MRRTHTRAVVHGTLIIIPLLLAPATSLAQETASVADSLVARALADNPRVRTAEARSEAARLRIGPAGAWSDPVLRIGIQNVPVSLESAGDRAGPDPMTMKMIGIGQTVPFPGKTSLRSSVARATAEAAEARLAAVRLAIRREVLDAYYELAAARSVLALVDRQQQVAASVLPAAEARYVAGTAAQSDVLKARTEAAFLVEERNAALQQERAALARLNAAIGRFSAVPPLTQEFSIRMIVPELPSLDSLVAVALRRNPRLREGRAIVAAQSAQAGVARREYLPDLDFTLQYGQRDARPDLLTATVGIPLPIQRGRRQSALARAAESDLAAAEAALRAEEIELRAQIATGYSQAQRHRSNAELLSRAILPQAEATFASASASYQSGRGDLLHVLDAMRALFATESMYVRALAELVRSIAELRMLVGVEVVR